MFLESTHPSLRSIESHFISYPVSDFEAANKSVGSTITSPRQVWLPWGTQTRSSIAATSGIIDMQAAGDSALRPGEIVMRTLFADFTQQTEKKIEAVMLEPSVSRRDKQIIFKKYWQMWRTERPLVSKWDGA